MPIPATAGLKVIPLTAVPLNTPPAGIADKVTGEAVCRYVGASPVITGASGEQPLQ